MVEEELKNVFAGVRGDDDFRSLKTEFPWFPSRESLKSRPGPGGLLPIGDLFEVFSHEMALAGTMAEKEL